MKKLLFALFLAVLCFADTSRAQEKTIGKLYEFNGVVKTPDSAVYAGIPLFFKGGGMETFVSTNINGVFKVELAPGKYEITVRESISKTFKAFIVIQENGLNPNNVEFVVEPTAESSYPKIVKLTKPPYPAAARAVRASGEVIVEVKIDREGKVFSANAVSGHPLLRSMSVLAAQNSLFETSQSDELREAKLTFVFLSGAEEKPNVKRYSNPNRVDVISSVVPIDITAFQNS